MNASNYSQTIARELVHKRAIGEVLVTAVTGQQRSWTCHVQLPRRHHFHTDMAGGQQAYHDPLLVLEAFRQSCIAASHLFYDVPMDARHTVRYYELSVVDLTALQRGRTALDLELNISVRKEFRQGLDVCAVVTHEGTKVMEFSTAFGWMSATQWETFRVGAAWEPASLAAPAAPARVGRTNRENVVIGEPVISSDTASAPILVDIAHPTIFDHPLDHLPGGLIIEACRQLALAVMGQRAAQVTGLASLRCDYQSFTELDAISTATVAQATDDELTFRGTVTQSGETRAAIELTFSAE
jgi:hypothetical protein